MTTNSASEIPEATTAVVLAKIEEIKARTRLIRARLALIAIPIAIVGIAAVTIGASGHLPEVQLWGIAVILLAIFWKI